MASCPECHNEGGNSHRRWNFLSAPSELKSWRIVNALSGGEAYCEVIAIASPRQSIA
jgi:hypothetical protein